MSLIDQAMKLDTDLDTVAAGLLVKTNSAEGPTSDPAPQPGEKDDDQIQDRDAKEAPVDTDDDLDDDDPGAPQDDQDDDEEPQDGDTDDGEETDDEQYYQVKADGELHEVTLKELLRSYSGQKAINNRLQKATEKLKQTEGQAAAIAQNQKEITDARDAYLSGLEQVQTILGSDDESEVDWDALYETDREAWGTQRELYRSRKEQKEAVATEQARVKAEKVKEEQQQFGVYVQSQQKLLAEKLPVMADPKVGPELRVTLAKLAMQYGYVQQELAAVVDHRPMLILNALHEALQGKVKTVGKAKRKRRTKSVIIPGTGTRRAVQTSRQEKELDRLQKRAVASGKAEDVADLMIARSKTGG